jgi:hypothetical protein
MEPPVEIRYAGVIVGRAQEVRTVEGDLDSFFLYIREPLPVGSTLQLRSGDKETPARVVQSVEALDPDKSGIQIQFIGAEEAEKGLVPPPFNLEKFLAEAPPVKAPVAAPIRTTVSGTFTAITTKAASSKVASSDAIPVMPTKGTLSGAVPVAPTKSAGSDAVPVAPVKTAKSDAVPVAPTIITEPEVVPVTPPKAEKSDAVPTGPVKTAKSDAVPTGPVKTAKSDAVPTGPVKTVGSGSAATGKSTASKTVPVTPAKSTDSEAVPVTVAKSMSEAIETAARVAPAKQAGRTTLLMGSASEAVPVTVGNSVTDALYNATKTAKPNPVKETSPQGTPINEQAGTESAVPVTIAETPSASQTSPLVAKPVQGPHKRGRSKKRK